MPKMREINLRQNLSLLLTLSLLTIVSPSVLAQAKTSQPSLLGAVALPRLEQTYEQIFKLFEPVFAMVAARDNRGFVRDVMRRLYPSVQHIKLHNLFLLLPKLAKPLGIALNKPAGFLVYMYKGHLAPVLMLTIAPKTFLRNLRLLGLNPSWQQEGVMQYLVLGHKASKSIAAWRQGNQLYLTVRNIPRRMGLQTDTEIRGFFTGLAKLHNPLDAAFPAGGRNNLWHQALQGRYDLVMSLPTLKMLAILPPARAIAKFVTRMQLGISMKQGHRHVIEVETTDALAPFLTLFKATTPSAPVYAHAPASTVWLGQTHINLKALIQLLKNLPAFTGMSPSLKSRFERDWTQTMKKLKGYGASLTLFPKHFSGQMVSGLAWSKEHAKTVNKFGPVHGAFFMLGLQQTNGLERLIQDLKAITDKMQKIAHPPGKILQIQKQTKNDLKLYQLTFLEKFKLTVFSRDKMLIASSDPITAKQLLNIQRGQGSLTQELKRNPSLLQVFDQKRQSFAFRFKKLQPLIIPYLQQQRLAYSRKKREQATVLLSLLHHLVQGRTYTTIQGRTVRMGMEMSMSHTKTTLPHAQKGKRIRLPFTPSTLVLSAFTAMFNSYPLFSLTGFLAQLHNKHSQSKQAYPTKREQAYPTKREQAYPTKRK